MKNGSDKAGALRPAMKVRWFESFVDCFQFIKLNFVSQVLARIFPREHKILWRIHITKKWIRLEQTWARLQCSLHRRSKRRQRGIEFSIRLFPRMCQRLWSLNSKFLPSLLFNLFYLFNSDLDSLTMHVQIHWAQYLQRNRNFSKFSSN